MSTPPKELVKAWVEVANRAAIRSPATGKASRFGFPTMVKGERLTTSLSSGSGVVKYEEANLKDYSTVAVAIEGLGNYFEFYNHQRLNQALTYQVTAAVHFSQ